MSTATFVPYCGAPPVPGHLTWNTDPVLIAVLLAIGAAYVAGCRGNRAPKPRERMLFGAGLLIVAAALISPLCNLSVALFSARVAQHMALTLIAAPLIALGRPECVLPHSAMPARSSAAFGRQALSVSAVAFAIAIWTWHMPGPYDETLRNNYVYWTMHVTMFGAALLLWHALLVGNAGRAGMALIAGFGTAMHMSLLAAVLTLAPKALFAVHFNTTWPWGLSPLDDQQLGGVIMWIPAGVLSTIYGVAAFAHWLNTAGRPAQSI
jgi:putative membrane protein